MLKGCNHLRWRARKFSGGLPSTSEVGPSSVVAPPKSTSINVSTLVERLIAVGLIPETPNEEKKMKTVEPDIKKEKCNPAKEESKPAMNFSIENLRRHYPSVIAALYAGTFCVTCEMRFKDPSDDPCNRHSGQDSSVNAGENEVAKSTVFRWYPRVNEEPGSELPSSPADTMLSNNSTADTEQKADDKCPVASDEDSVPKDYIEREDDRVEYTKELDGHLVEQENEQESSVVMADETFKVKVEPAEEESLDCQEPDEEMEAKPLDSKTSEAEMKEEPTYDRLGERELEEILDGKPGEEKIIGVISESAMQEEERKEPEESEMVVLKSGGIVMKVRAASIQKPTEPTPQDNDEKKEEESGDEEEFRPPTPDPRFKVLPPVQKGVQDSGFCTIM